MDAKPNDDSLNDATGCPHLPKVEQVLTAEWTRVHRGRKGASFYQAALEYGQSLWMQGKPAQAILQLNKAWSAELNGDEPVLGKWPLPYRALLWMLENAPEDTFFGNPVRHFQHLATRVGGEGVELRSWRAWACYHLSRQVLSASEFPSDNRQIESEGIVIPKREEVFEALLEKGLPGEADLFAGVFKEAMHR